jgi:hypothetical protein
LKIPFEPADEPHKPEILHRKDIFHIVKVGTGRDCVGSCIFILAMLTYFDLEPHGTKNIDDRLCRAHSLLELYAISCGKTLFLRSFTKASFNIKRVSSSFPWIGCKGSDTMILFHWLVFFLGILDVRPEHEYLVKAMKETCQACINYFDLMYPAGLWLHKDIAEQVRINGLTYIRGYAYLAKACLNLGLPGFGLKPKLHSHHHQVMEIHDALRRGAEYVLSPLCFSCEVNEDFIGRVCRITRGVSQRTVKLRTLQYYLVQARSIINGFTKTLQYKKAEQC